MIFGYIHQGSGIGNQLHRYIATRVKAEELGTDWRMIYNPDNSGKDWGFKAKFITFDSHKLVNANDYEWSGYRRFNEKKITEHGIDVRSYDPEWNFIEDNTVIDGEFQDERYWERNDGDVGYWLRTEPLDIPDYTCVIGFRGGEFSLYPDLFLGRDYYERAMDLMVEKYGIKKFEVHTDDPVLAKEFFGDVPVVNNPEINWRSMRWARYAIVANSSFFILPRWLNGVATIAPRCWGRRNMGVWSLPQNYYKRFTYI